MINDARFTRLCWELFRDNPIGHQFIDVCKEYMMEPVAAWDKPANYAFFREGENNFIRRMIQSIEAHEKLVKLQKEKTNDE